MTPLKKELVALDAYLQCNIFVPVYMFYPARKGIKNIFHYFCLFFMLMLLYSLLMSYDLIRWHFPIHESDVPILVLELHMPPSMYLGHLRLYSLRSPDSIATRILVPCSLWPQPLHAQALHQDWIPIPSSCRSCRSRTAA